MASINGYQPNTTSANAVGKTASSVSGGKQGTANTNSAFAQTLLATMTAAKSATTQPVAAVGMSDVEIKALTRSGKSPQEVAAAFKAADVNIYDVARATASNVNDLRALADSLGMDYIDPYKDDPALCSAMDKLCNNSGGFTRIGVDADGKLHLQTAGSGGMFGWQNMDQIRMSDNSTPSLVQATAGSAGLFKLGLLNQQELDALTPYLPQLRDTSIQYSTGGYPTAWSQQEWNATALQRAFAAGNPGSGQGGTVQKA